MQVSALADAAPEGVAGWSLPLNMCNGLASTTARTHVLSDMLLGVGCEAATAYPPFPSCQHFLDFVPQKLGKGEEGIRGRGTIDRHFLCSISLSRLEAS